MRAARPRRARSPPPARAAPSSPAVARLDRVQAREAVQEQPPAVPRDGDEGAVREAEHLPSGTRVQGVDAVLAVAEVDDPVDDRGRAGDLARGGKAPAR